MQIEETSFSVASEDRFAIHNISAEVQASIEQLGLEAGLAFIRTRHTTAAVSTNEDETKLEGDTFDKFKQLVPPDGGYHHDIDHLHAGEHPNAHAHILSAMIKRPVFLPVKDGDIGLGTWEDVLFYELAGPNDRTVDVYALE